MLIEDCMPVWNLVIDGFGNKTPGKLRETQKRSAWDVLHYGREFAKNLGANKQKIEHYENKLKKFFDAPERTPLVNLDDQIINLDEE